MPPKQRDAMLLMIDCGPHMNKIESNGSTSFECAKKTADWIITRKIFTQSCDEINIGTFNCDPTDSTGGNIFGFADEDFSVASFEHIRFLRNNVKVADENHKDAHVIYGLNLAVSTIQNLNLNVQTQTVVFFTNENCFAPRKSLDTFVESLNRSFRSKSLRLIIVGVQQTDDLESMEIQLLRQLVDSAGGSTLSYEQTENTLYQFYLKPVKGRAMRKALEILPGIELPLAFYLRSTPAKNPMKAVTVNDKGEQMMRETQYFVQRTRAQSEELEEQQMNDLETVNGYLFGKSKIVVTDDDIAEYNNHNFNEGDKGGVLKLLQFTKRSNILHSFYLGNNSYTVVPQYDVKSPHKYEKTLRISQALFESMYNKDVVAICRYAYNAASNLQLMALIPQKSKDTNQIYLTGIRLPFMDDWRPFSLPDITVRCPPPTTERLEVIDQLIDSMELSHTAINFDKILNPTYQRLCDQLKMKGLAALKCADRNQDLNPEYYLKRGLVPDSRITESEAYKLATSQLNEIFELEEVIRAKRRKRDYEAQEKDFLKGRDEVDEEQDEDEIKTEREKLNLPDPDGPHKKFWDKIRKTLEAGGNSIETWMNKTATDMSLFDEGNLAAAEEFLILRSEMLAAKRIQDFNKWLMSLHGNDDYSDFFQFMDSRNELSLITNDESPESWYTNVESQMFWSGLLDEDKKK